MKEYKLGGWLNSEMVRLRIPEIVTVASITPRFYTCIFSRYSSTTTWIRRPLDSSGSSSYRGVLAHTKPDPRTPCLSLGNLTTVNMVPH